MGRREFEFLSPKYGFLDFCEYFVEIFTGKPFSGSENPDLVLDLRWSQDENRKIAIFGHFTPKNFF